MLLLLLFLLVTSQVFSKNRWSGLFDHQGHRIGNLVSFKPHVLEKSGFYFKLDDFDFKRSERHVPDDFNYQDPECKKEAYLLTSLPISNVVVKVDDKNVYYTTEKVSTLKENTTYYVAQYVFEGENIRRLCKVESPYETKGIYLVELKSLSRETFKKKTGIDFSKSYKPPFFVK
ncbi:MAG: hypothetical protein KDD48_04850 [Bdellovibrionales bacterium]|nr:hypothetical protein [Bdellovibrionales bacterium]